MKKIVWLALLALAILIGWRIYVQIKDKQTDDKGSGRSPMVVPVVYSFFEEKLGKRKAV